MNKLILIGNGFDLAHGLKTKYTDFILSYLNNIMSALNIGVGYEDDLIVAKRTADIKPKSDFISLNEFRNYLIANQHYDVSYKYSFINDLINSPKRTKWVDIESFYYETLVNIFKKYDEALDYKKADYIEELIKLNSCFSLVKKRLIEYLKIIDLRPKKLNIEIRDNFLYEFTIPKNRSKEALFLNFNYTSTLSQYINMFNPEMYKVNNIHGELNNKMNPIIFGYGDEMDSYYSKIERLNNNEFLNNMKSFNYFQTTNYLDFLRFIDSDRFTVYIVGHSCGLSDKILLNSIFEHKNCRFIKIFYHQMNESEDDFFEKTQDISRHFNSANKGLMRSRILPKVESKPLIEYLK